MSDNLIPVDRPQRFSWSVVRVWAVSRWRRLVHIVLLGAVAVVAAIETERLARLYADAANDTNPAAANELVFAITETFLLVAQVTAFGLGVLFVKHLYHLIRRPRTHLDAEVTP